MSTTRKKIKAEFNSFIDDISLSLNNDDLVFFIGGGISKLCGYPLWGELANDLLKACAQEKCISNYALNNYKNSQNSPMRKISIACSILEKNGKKPKEFIRRLLCKNIDNPIFLNNKKKLESIFNSLKCRIVTTNVDSNLDSLKLYKENVLRKLDAVSIAKYDLKIPCLIHIHGSIQDLDSMVFTTKDYLDHYTRKDFIEPLKKIFENNTKIVFIGYSLSEFEIIRYLYEASLCKNKNYIIGGYYLKSNIEEYELDKNYFDTLNIGLIPFDLEKSYSEQIKFLDKIKSELTKKSHLSAKIDEIAIKIAHMRPDEYTKSLIQINYSNWQFIYLFMKNLETSEFLGSWILFLDKQINIFSPDYWIKKDNISKEWLGLSLLSQTVSKIKGSEDYSEIIKIIKKVLLKSTKLIKECNSKFIKAIQNRGYIQNQLLSLYFNFSECFVDYTFAEYVAFYIKSSKFNVYHILYLLKTNLSRYCGGEYKEQLLSIIKCVIDSSINLNTSYDIDSFYDMDEFVSNSNFISIVGDEFFNLICQHLYKIGLSKPFAAPDVGSFYKCDKYKLYPTNISFLSKWFIATVEYCDNESYIKWFNKFHDLKNNFYIKICCCLLNLRFSMLNNFLDFSDILDNYFAISDFAYLLEENRQIILGNKEICYKINNCIEKLNINDNFERTFKSKNILLSILYKNSNKKTIKKFNFIMDAKPESLENESKLIIVGHPKDYCADLTNDEINILKELPFNSKCNSLIKYKNMSDKKSYDKYRYLANYFSNSIDEILANVNSIDYNSDLSGYLLQTVYSKYYNNFDIFVNFLYNLTKKFKDKNVLDTKIIIDYLANISQYCKSVNQKYIDILILCKNGITRLLNAPSRISGINMWEDPFKYIHYNFESRLLHCLLKIALSTNINSDFLIPFVEKYYLNSSYYKRSILSYYCYELFLIDRKWFLKNKDLIFETNDYDAFYISLYSGGLLRDDIYDLFANSCKMKNFIQNFYDARCNKYSNLYPYLIDLIFRNCLKNFSASCNLYLLTDHIAISYIIDLFTQKINTIYQEEDFKKYKEYIESIHKDYKIDERFAIGGSENVFNAVCKSILRLKKYDTNFLWDFLLYLSKKYFACPTSELVCDLIDTFAPENAKTATLFLNLVKGCQENEILLNPTKAKHIYTTIRKYHEEKANAIYKVLITKFPLIYEILKE